MSKVIRLPQIEEAPKTVDVVSAIEQSRSRGEIFQATKAGVLDEGSVLELGNVVRDRALGRTSDGQITIADLTGVAVQDIQISKAVYEAVQSGQ